MSIKFTKLTRLNMRNLNPGGRISEHGIEFSRLKNGDGVFSVNVMVDGIRIHRTIGKESEGVTRKQAEDFIEKARTDARLGRLSLPKGRKIALGFQTASQKYLKKLAEEGGKDLEKKKQRFDLHLNPFFKEMPLDKLASFDIERYKKHRQEIGASPGTINRELAVISHMLNKALEWGWLNHKPCNIKRFKEEQSRITYLTTEQIQRLLEAAKADPCPELYPFIVIGLETGMRRMEILSIRIENIDLNRRMIFIPNAKAGPREQPITKHLAEFLKKMIDSIKGEQGWLFSSTGRKQASTGHFMNIERPFRRAVEKAKLDLKLVTRHTLRHTAITHLVQAGVDLPTVKRISGHKTLQMVERYSHQNGAHIDKAMNILEKRYQTVALDSLK